MKIWACISKRLLSIKLATLLAGLSAQAFAADAGGWLQNWWDEPWQFNAKVYGWLPDAPADIRVKDQSIGLPESVDTILDSLNYVFMGEFEVHKGRLGLFVSPVYYDGTDKQNFTGPLGANRRLEVKERVWLVDYGLGFEALTLDLGKQENPPTLTLSPFAGFRYFHDPIRMSVDPGGLFPGIKFKTTVDINTPIVGLKGYVRVNDRWSLGAEYDHGVMDDDEVEKTWQWSAVLAHHFKIKSVSSQVYVGYRQLKLQLDNEDVEVNVDVKGPLIGVGVDF